MLIDERYKVLSSLSNGSVYKVADIHNDSVLALKLCRSEEADVVMEFKNEFFTLANLAHPNIVKVHDFNKTKDEYYFTMEFVDGDNIFDHFVSGKGDRQSLYSVIAELLQVLHHLHQNNLIHGDIKPQNVMIQNERVKLLDFGLARVVGASDRAAGGTLAYIAPELFKGGKIDPRVDLYSLGVVLYEILRGKKLRSFQEKLAPLREPVPKPLRNLVSRLTRRDPDLRYSCIREVWEDLREHLPKVKLEFKPSALASRTIGRDVEMSELHRLHADSRRQGRAVLIVGERGVGKSRILRELAYGLQLEECHVVHLACPRDAAPAFGLVRRLLQAGGREVKGELEVSGSLPQESARLRLFEELTGILGEIAETRKPLALLVDELDCADPLSIEFLCYFAPEMAAKNIFFVGAAEDEAKLVSLFGQTTNTDLVSKMQLKRLGQEETRAMIASMLSSNNLDSIAEWVYKKTGGNPLHVEKTLDYLIKVGHVFRVRDGWAIDRVKAEKLKPAPSLRSIIDISLRSCEKDELTLLQHASVIGNFFDIRFLQRLSGYDDSQFYPMLLRLRYSDVIREVKDTEYGFSHGWMRGVLYEKISPSRRKKLHLEAFRILSESGGAPEALFCHAINSGLDSEAYDYALLAAENAERSFAHPAALHYLETARNLSRKLKRKKDPILYERLGDLYHITGSYGEALRNYGAAIQLSPASHHLHLKTGKIHRDRGEFVEAISHFKKVPASRSPSYLDALNQTGWAYLQTSELMKARQSTLKAKAAAERRGNRKSLSDSYHNLAQVALSRGRQKEAIRHFQSSLRMKKEIGDDHGTALTQNNLGILYWKSGEIAEAERCFARSLELMEEIGDVKAVGLLSNNLGMIHSRKAEWDKALQQYEKSCGIYTRIGDKKSLVAVYNNLAEVYGHRVQWRKAIEFYKKSLILSEEMDMVNERAITLQNIGSILLEVGRPEEARPVLWESLALRNRTGDRGSEARVMVEIGRYWVECGMPEKALSVLDDSIKQLSVGGYERDLARAHALRALLYLKMDRFRRAEADLSKAELHYRKSEDVAGPGRTERLRGLLYSLKGQSSDALTCFNRSLEIFRGIDKEYECGVTLLELAHHSLRSWNTNRDPEDIREALADLKKAEEIFARLEVEGRLEEAHKTSVEVLDLISGDFLRSYSRANQLDTLYEISKLINSILDLDLLFNTTMELVIQLLNAERGVLLLLNPNAKKLEVAAGKEMDKETVRDVTKLSKSVIARVAKKGEPIICMDALSDTRFKNHKSVILHKIRSLLCVPLKTNEEVLGTIYVDSRLSDNVFGERDKDFLVALANLVAVAIDRARLHRKMEKETVDLKREVVKSYTFQGLVGKSEEMQEAYGTIEKVSRTDSTVLLTGESGTGKDLVARAIHILSNRRDGPYVVVSSAAIAENLLESELFGHVKGAFTGATEEKEGLFAAADTGTIFLNEIGDAPPSVQAKLLRVLETGEIRRVGETRCRKVNVRVICATNKDLKEEIASSRFREDLYYRLNVVHISLPPLRDRKDDIPLIADHFRRLCSKMLNKEIKEFSQEVLDFLCKHDWRGNVRQLENCIARACALSDSSEITVEDLKLDEEEKLPEEMGLRAARQSVEISRIKKALKRCGGNRTKAARVLGIRRQQLQRYIKKYGIATA